MGVVGRREREGEREEERGIKYCQAKSGTCTSNFLPIASYVAALSRSLKLPYTSCHNCYCNKKRVVCVTVCTYVCMYVVCIIIMCFAATEQNSCSGN